jgi:hypothetical protein
MTTVAAGSRMVRTRGDVVLLVGGTVLLVLSALPVRRHSISGLEAHVFHAINTHTVLPFVVVWPIMQLGNIGAVPIAAAVAAILRKWRLAAGILLGGLVTYFLAKVVKKIVVRGRPPDLVDDHIVGRFAHRHNWANDPQPDSQSCSKAESIAHAWSEFYPPFGDQDKIDRAKYGTSNRC